MGVSVGAGLPTYSGVTIPELWPLRTADKMYAQTRVAQFASTDYENELKKMGDVAHIRVIPSLTARPYVIGQDMVPNTTGMTTVDLTINQAYYFDEELDNVVAQQSNLDILNIYQDAIAQESAVNVDSVVLAGIQTGAHADNIGATAGVKSGFYDLGTTGASIPITEDNAMHKLVHLLAVLKEQNVNNNMWLLVPSWYSAKLKLSDLRFANETGDGSSIVRTGLVGAIDGVEVWESNNMTSVTDGTDSNTCWYALAGHKSAIAFAQTIEYARIVEPSSRFSKRMQALVVFGYQVVSSQYMSALYCRPAA